MTNDLISRQAAVKLLTDKADGYYVSMFATSDECHVARVVALEAANEIESLPAVDAAPVVHGRWIEKPFLLGTTRECSKCGDYYGMPHGVFNYCPNCGAKMDLEGKRDD